MSNWLKRLFSGPARTDAPLDVAAETGDEKSLDEARIDAGGGGALGLTNDPTAHASPGEELAESEPGAE